MPSFFFFGTLQDPDLREAVLGNAMPDRSIVPAALDGYRLVRLKSQAQPGLVRRPGDSVDGLFVRDVEVSAAARLMHYECDAYELAHETVRLASGNRRKAWVFLSDPDLAANSEDWSLERWRSRHKERSLAVAREWMARLDDAARAALESEWRARERAESKASLS